MTGDDRGEVTRSPGPPAGGGGAAAIPGPGDAAAVEARDGSHLIEEVPEVDDVETCPACGGRVERETTATGGVCPAAGDALNIMGEVVRRLAMRLRDRLATASPAERKLMTLDLDRSTRALRRLELCHRTLGGDRTAGCRSDCETLLELMAEDDGEGDDRDGDGDGATSTSGR